jgi:CheY-like chemotaxis protein
MFSQRNPRILVVDDDAFIRTCVAEILRDEGYEVLEAPHGAAALSLVDECPPDLILLDMRMPVLDGWGFTRAYRQRPGPHAPIIVMTAAQDAAQRAAQVRCESYLAKPFELDDLLDCIEQFTGSGHDDRAA